MILDENLFEDMKLSEAGVNLHDYDYEYLFGGLRSRRKPEDIDSTPHYTQKFSYGNRSSYSYNDKNIMELKELRR